MGHTTIKATAYYYNLVPLFADQLNELSGSGLTEILPDLTDYLSLIHIFGPREVRTLQRGPEDDEGIRILAAHPGRMGRERPQLQRTDCLLYTSLEPFEEVL